MKILLLLILNSFAVTQNYIYDESDWLIVSNPGNISSMTYRFNDIIFTSDKGVFIYEKLSKTLYLMNDFIRGFEESDNHIVHYDNFRDHLWFLDNEKLYFKPYSSSIWREKYLYDYDLFSYADIKNIGSDNSFIYVKTNQYQNGILILDPYTGNIVEDVDFIDYDNIHWSSTKKDTYPINFDLGNFNSFSGYSFYSSKYIEYNGNYIHINTALLDDDKNIWIGTNSGEIFKCNLYSNSFDRIKNIPFYSDINTVYLDDYHIWWMSHNESYKYIDDQMYLSNDDAFIVYWDEDKNTWESIKQNISSNVSSKDITDIYRFQNFLYVGTNKGLLIYNVREKKWSYIKDSNAVYVYEIIRYNNKIFLATDKGIKELLYIENKFLFQNIALNNYNTYSFEILENYIYILTTVGVFKYDMQTNEAFNISNKKFNEILINDKDIYLSDKNNLYINPGDKEYVINIDNTVDLCFCNNHLWTNQIDYSSVINLEDFSVVEYNLYDGIPGDKINDIGCDDEWVWFATNKGFALYNWSKYHAKNN